VSLRDGPLGEIKAPVAWVAAGVLIVVLIGAVALFVAGGSRTGPAGQLRGAADSVTAPVGGVLAAPVRVAGEGLGAVGAYFMAGSQNRQLRADLAAALTWRDEALVLRQENARLRGLLGLRTTPPLPMVSANTVLDARGPFSNSRLADAGAAEGVVEGNPVLSDHGLVGRIVGVSPHASRIMLLTDIDSRTPVMIARTNGRAILTGDGGPNPQLAYLRTHDAPEEGDRVLTSGDGGVVPRGLPVGTVVKGFDGAWRVALDADAEPIDFVRILLFKDISQVATPADLTPNQLPGAATDVPEAPPPTAALPSAPATAKPAGPAPAAKP
jgi:rod shape-determining protein MreC